MSRDRSERATSFTTWSVQDKNGKPLGTVRAQTRAEADRMASEHFTAPYYLQRVDKWS